MQKYNSLKIAIRKRPIRVGISALAATTAGWMMLSGLSIEPASLHLPWSGATATQPEYAALSDSDIKVYRLIFDLQAEGKWDAADALIATLDQDYLLGSVLASRYLHSDYESSAEELDAWLNAYADLPEAQSVLALAEQKDATRKWPSLPETATLKMGPGVYDSPAWRAALDSFEAGRMQDAAEQFSKLAEKGHPAPQFWAYRALDGLGKAEEARAMLLKAALHPDSFYGMMALATLDRSNDADRASLSPTAPLVLHRTQGLLALERSQEAQENWQAALEQAGSEPARTALLAQASDAGLPVVQLARSSQMALHYARPDWTPSGGYKLQSALLMAVARKESLFKPTARSHRGASGVMQLMPATARYVGERFGRKAWLSNLESNLHKPEISLALGQDYLTYLLNKPYINQNLIYMLAAYNAGPGPLLKWQKEFSAEDPLLFLERIPFSETRHYVREVMKNYWVYRLLEGDSQHSMQAMADSRWPIYWDGGQRFVQADIRKTN